MKKLVTAKKNRATKPPQHDIVKRVQLLPELTGMTFYAIAQAIGKNQSAINNIVNRGTLPSAEMLRLFCEALQLNANWLILGEGNWKRPQKRHTTN